MSIHIIMDGSGDTRHEFDLTDARALARAETRFRGAHAEGLLRHCAWQGWKSRASDARV